MNDERTGLLGAALGTGGEQERPRFLWRGIGKYALKFGKFIPNQL